MEDQRYLDEVFKAEKLLDLRKACQKMLSDKSRYNFNEQADIEKYLDEIRKLYLEKGFRIEVLNVSPDELKLIAVPVSEQIKIIINPNKPFIAKKWEDLEGLESENYKIVLDEDKASGWIVPKEETDESRGENYFDHHAYLSTHSFYAIKDQYQYTNKLLSKFGFNVEVVGY